MSKVRIIFLGTPDFAVEPLKSLYNDEHFEIVKVITQPDRPKGRNLHVQPCEVKKTALDLGLDVMAIENINDAKVLEQIKTYRAESAVVIAFGQILKEDFLDLFPLGVVNVHASILPRWRGAAPIQRAIQYGDEITGVTLQKVVLKLDAGPIIGVRNIKITDQINSTKMYELMKPLASDLLKVDYMDYLRGNLTPKNQDEKLVTIAKKIDKEEGLIDWNQSATVIFNCMWAFSNWPGIWTYRNQLSLKIIRAEVMKSSAKTPLPGRVIEITNNFFVVSCGKEALKIFEVQPESKSKMLVEDYLRGYPLKVGDVFDQKK